MKKVLLGMTALMLVVAVQADLVNRTWSSQYVYANVPLGVPAASDGYGWQTDIALTGTALGAATLAPNAGTSVNLGWYVGNGYYVGGFQFDAVEQESVVMRIFDGTVNYLDSQPIVLADIEGTPGPNDFDVTFDFTGSEWVAIPEPATIGLMGIAGIGMFLARRKVRA